MSFQITTQATLGTLVSEVAKAVGFAVTVADAAGSTDPAVAQMTTAVNDAAAELVGQHDWPDLITESSLSVMAAVPGDALLTLALPADFFKFVNQTQNDQTARLPTRNPLTAGDWQSIKTLAPFVSFNLMWRVKGGNQVQFLNPPSIAHTFTFEYLSQAYVIDADTPTLFKNVATKNGDLFKFDPYLLRLLAVCHWRETKGFDSTGPRMNYDAAYRARFNRQEAGSVISTRGSPMSPVFRPIDSANIPETGFGL